MGRRTQGRSAEFWKFGEALRARDEREAQGLHSVCIGRRNVTNNVLEMPDGTQREDYLVAHEDTIFSTSSMGRPSPRSSCAKPSRTAATDRKSTRLNSSHRTI